MRKEKNYITFYFYVTVVSILGILAIITKQYLNKTYQLHTAFTTKIVLLLTAVILFVTVYYLIYLFVLKICGFQIKMFTLWGFFYADNQSGNKIGFNYKSGLIGSVVPVILDVKTRKELTILEKKLAYCSLIPPLFSILCIMICFCVQKWLAVIPSGMGTSIWKFAWSGIFVNICINIFAFIIDPSAMSGGYRVCKMFLNGDLEAVRQIALYINLSNMTNCNQLDKLNNVIEEVFDEKCNQRADNIECTWYIDKILYQSLLYDEQLNKKIELLINEFIENLKNKNFLREAEVVLLAHTVMYFFRNDINKAVTLWNSLENKIPKSKLYEYYQMQIEGFLYGKKDYLKAISIRKSSMDNLFMVLDNYFNSEKIIINKILEGNI